MNVLKNLSHAIAIKASTIASVWQLEYKELILRVLIL